MNSAQTLKTILSNNNQQLQQQFNQDVDISQLLKERSQTIDGLLQDMWQQHQLNESLRATLVAVGGYGREEMHPASDVDLLILLETEPDAQAEEKLSNYVTQLWDLGLEIGQSVRTLDECVEEASNDLTVISNLIESRYLCGEKALFEQLHERVGPDKIWSSQQFFLAKVDEQKERYLRYGDTAYRVEPNLKDGPGGLRDLQMIGWIVLREYGISSLKTLSESHEHDLLNVKEYRALIEARDFLWKVRFVLHQLTGRKEDRLLFDHQRHLAHSFGYTNDEKNQSIEAFMQRYYRTITELERLNDILLGLLREHILQTTKTPAILINNYYRIQDNYLDLVDKEVFKTHPHTLLEIFNILQVHSELIGLTPQTIRELRRNLPLIDEDFRSNSHNKHIFINIMSAPHRVNFVLRKMNRYGVLAAYIPAFANIVGRMQYDLFHAYTVDDHTLNVVRNIRVLSTPKGAKELPMCSEIFQTIEKPMLLCLAGIFHDIAKGRGGSHSELGAIDALEFCLSHELSRDDAELVSWLVEQHLLVSSVAQRKDINDPDVIKEFAEIVVTPERLDYLYLLTICDIKGTNPTLLNTWKHSLLKQLYNSTRKYLHSDTLKKESNETIIDREILHKKQSVLALAEKSGMDKDLCKAFWNRFNDDYLLQYSSERLFWHLKVISKAEEKNEIDPEYIIRIGESKDRDSSVLLIYTLDQPQLFIKITSAIEQQGLDTVAASINSTNDGYSIFTFYLLNTEGNALQNDDDKQQLIDTIEANLKQQQLSYNFQHQRTPRQLKHFNTETKVKFDLDKMHHQTVITISTADGPGLLTRIGAVFHQQNLNIHNARITTLGEIAEDIFHVTSHSGKVITDLEKQDDIESALKQKLQS
jgi:[protein-PII] uridylyltransferase